MDPRERRDHHRSVAIRCVLGFPTGLQKGLLLGLDRLDMALNQTKHRHRPLNLRPRPRRQRRSIAGPCGREPFQKVRLARRQIENAMQLQEPLDPVVEARAAH